MEREDGDNVQEIRSVGKSGQISLGKRYAGKLFRVETLEDGRILLTSVVAVPESELWTLREPHASRIDEGMKWAAETPPVESDRKAIFARARAKKAASRRKA